jgi:hypothetical protein
LAAIDSAFSLILSAATDDEPPRDSVEVGVVVVHGQVYVRAYRGTASEWFQAIQVLGRGTIRVREQIHSVRFGLTGPTQEPELALAIDSAYEAKYGSLANGTMTSQMRNATVRITPSD